MPRYKWTSELLNVLFDVIIVTAPSMPIGTTDTCGHNFYDYAIGWWAWRWECV
jgi:hypothetical protein